MARSVIITGPLLILSEAFHGKQPIHIETECRNAFFRFPIRNPQDLERLRAQYQKGEVDLRAFEFRDAECQDGEAGLFTVEGQPLTVKHPERIKDEEVIMLVNLERAELLIED